MGAPRQVRGSIYDRCGRPRPRGAAIGGAQRPRSRMAGLRKPPPVWGFAVECSHIWRARKPSGPCEGFAVMLADAYDGQETEPPARPCGMFCGTLSEYVRTYTINRCGRRAHAELGATGPGPGARALAGCSTARHTYVWCTVVCIHRAMVARSNHGFVIT